MKNIADTINHRPCLLDRACDIDGSVLLFLCSFVDLFEGFEWSVSVSWDLIECDFDSVVVCYKVNIVVDGVPADFDWHPFGISS